MNDSHQPGHRDRPKAGREVEAGFERLLKDALTQQERASAGSECVDFETLAAWSEGVLPPSERSMVEAHAARCIRCQEMLATMARTAPVEAARGSWSLRHWIMMLAPAATATAAVILWFAIEPRRPVSDAPAHQVAANTEVDKLTSPQATGAPVPPAEARAGTRDDRGASDRPAAKEKEAGPPARLAEAKDSDRYLRENPRPANPTAESTIASTRARQELAAAVDEERRRKAGAAAERSASDALADAKSSSRPAATTPVAGAAAPSVVAEPIVTPVTPPPPPPAAPVAVTPIPSSQARAPQTQGAQAQGAQTQTGQTQQSGDLQKSGQTAAFGGDAGRSGGTLNRATLNESVVIATLSIAPAGGSVQWRVLSGHIVQHSVDKGATWTTQYTLDETAQLAAGSAPSATTAWFVGRAGVVLATSDGRIWRRIAFPEAIDLIGVVAADARVAIVTSADRRVFATTDGGASWSPRKN